MASKERDGRPTEDGAEQMETKPAGELKGHQPTPFLNMWQIVGWMDDYPTKGIQRDM